MPKSKKRPASSFRDKETASFKKFPWVVKNRHRHPQGDDESPCYSMPLRTVEDDESVLRPAQAGEEPCMNGETCVAVVDIPGGPGTPCVSVKPSAKCLLCLRREARANYVKTTALGHVVPTDRVYQRWRSPVGLNGYAEGVCVGPDPDGRRYTGFIMPCAVGLVDHYTWICASGKWKVDQSPMYHAHFRKAPRENTEPRLGGASSVSYEDTPRR